MKNHPDDQQKKLAEIFSIVGMNDLPALSSHVQELVALVNSNKCTSHQLAEVILKDNALTTKILQVVNSPYYQRGTQVTTISRAVPVVGLDTLRQLAMSIAIFEEFIKAGVGKKEISRQLAMSYLSASFARILSRHKKLRLSDEEAFICGLLHDLGKIIVAVYLPETFRKIIQTTEAGYSESFSARRHLDGLSYSFIGMELARHWNFSDKIILAMSANPPRPNNSFDTNAYLLNLAFFANRLIAVFADGNAFEFKELIIGPGAIFSLPASAAVALLEKAIEASEDVSDVIRYGLSLLKARARLEALKKSLPPGVG